MIESFKAFFTLFQQGKELTNKEVWRNRAHATNVLAGVFSTVLVIANAAGYHFNLDQETINAIAGGVAALVAAFNSFVHTVPVQAVGEPPVS
jgi:hypothetical protein